MRRFKDGVRGMAGVALLVVFCGCLGAAPRPECRADERRAPLWVHHVESLGGYYVGMGQAEPVEGGLFAQRQLAGRRALADLIEKIQVTVESSMELSESQAMGAAGDVSVTRAAKRHLQVASGLTLNEVTDAGSYQDPSTCRLWMRVKIRRDLADNLLALKHARALFQQSLDETGATPAQTLRWVTEAQARLADVDFSVLPRDAGSRENLTVLFAARRVALEAMEGRHLVWLLSGASPLREALVPVLRDLAGLRGAFFVETPCSAAIDCLAQAREYAGKQLVWINATADISSGSMGMHKGALHLGIARFDVATGSLLATASEEGQGFAFEEGGIDWPGLAERLLTGEGMDTLLH